MGNSNNGIRVILQKVLEDHEKWINNSFKIGNRLYLRGVRVDEFNFTDYNLDHGVFIDCEFYECIFPKVSNTVFYNCLFYDCGEDGEVALIAGGGNVFESLIIDGSIKINDEEKEKEDNEGYFKED